MPNGHLVCFLTVFGRDIYFFDKFLVEIFKFCLSSHYVLINKAFIKIKIKKCIDK